MKVKRVFLLVLDSFGIGAEPDAAAFGDGDCNTLRSVSACPDFDVPHMAKLGLFHIDGVSVGKRQGKPEGALSLIHI